MSAPFDLHEHVKENVKVAIEKYRLGEPTSYTVQLAWTPTDQGNLRLAWNIVLVWRSPLIGQKLVQICIMPEPYPTPEQVDQFTLQGFEHLREMKARALSTVNGKGPR